MASEGRCPTCEVVAVNGLRCHETDCPTAWRDDDRECRWCGTKFTPDSRYQGCCSEDCERAFRGEPDPEFDRQQSLEDIAEYQQELLDAADGDGDL